MCGILVTNKDIGGLDSNYLEKDILRTLVNRGPDYTSHKIINQKYNFIHTLLSMTGPATPQPFQDIQDEIYCTFNGEIYNFEDLRKVLSAKGVKVFLAKEFVSTPMVSLGVVKKSASLNGRAPSISGRTQGLLSNSSLRAFSSMVIFLPLIETPGVSPPPASF